VSRRCRDAPASRRPQATLPLPLPCCPAGESALRAQLEAQPQDAPMLYCLPHMRMWTKLRPGVRSFLQQANER
jgi:hypothetical protein